MKRIRKVQKQLETDLLLIDNPIDLYYLTGQEVSTGRLLISPENAILYVDGRYYEQCKKSAQIEVRLMKGPDFFAKQWKYQNQRIGFDADFMTVSALNEMEKLKGEWIPFKSPIKKIREIKDAEEIATLRKAAALCVKGYEHVRTLLKEGVTERELAIELEIFWLKSGGEGLSFSPHIAFGAGSAHPHYHVSDTPLKKGDLVLIDIGVVCDLYHSDMTRVLFFGKPQEELQKIYEIVHQAQEKALELCRPGVEIPKVDQVSRDWIVQAGYGDYYPHSLGHGVGLEIHEFPTLNQRNQGTLAEGMVVTIEPGIYLPGLGGVRLEETVVITKEGYEILTIA